MTFINLSPNIAVIDVAKTALYYTNILGFDFVMGVTPEKKDLNEIPVENNKLIWAMLKKDNIEIMFQDNNSLLEDVPNFQVNANGDALTLYIEVDNIDTVYAEIINKVELIKDVNTTFYRMKEFIIRVCNGLIITFAQRDN